ncbi:MAG: hypothetical protein PWQ59_306 [Thermoanaerobacterium sp.]|jgi:hypothetical protein|uniref:hypothetical protein n=1 Tax=Thermoanaerobacterium thermosaccharolyticum TaxID=1517 RepID=UPI0024AA4B3C|nr:hypothetical protein [Thermoanaerobacterium sp.]MDK2805771.1 hypothetical protein [Thermoanaerobacterium sp.]MDN5316855.1 hypothetical protein [Thermoanaerobacterium sp.]WHE07120.1 hypothetical protein PGH24_13495 [Thermoanaerobacterium thermosaccharolyticum]
MNKKYISIMLIFIAVAFIVGFAVRTSFINANSVGVNDLEKFKIMRIGTISEDNLSLSNLINDSDVVVRGKALDEKMYLHGATMRQFKVDIVFKGDKDIKDTTVYIFEPSYFDFTHNLFYIYCGYNLMKDGEEYILFLKKWPYTNYLRYNPYYKNKNIYVLSHNNGIDKYSVNDHLLTKVVSDSQEFYGQISQYDFCGYSKDEVNKYNKVKSEVLNYFVQVK